MAARARKKGSRTSARTRTEHDLLGKKAIPARAYYGVQSARAMENFSISGVKLHLYPDIIRGMAMVKMAAARANHECNAKAMPRTVLKGIEAACTDLINGKLHGEFEIDVFQGGAGTSTNGRQRDHRQPRPGAHGQKQGRVQVLRPA
jgi:aspartate ammonia-lyase